MRTIKKAQLGGLIKKGIKQAVKANTKKVVVPPKLKASIKKSQSGPKKITEYSSEAERIAAGGPTNLQKYSYSKTNYDKPLFAAKEKRVKKSKPKTDKYGFDIRPDRNGGTHKKTMKSGGKIKKCMQGCK
jgi:hypothetical protein